MSAPVGHRPLRPALHLLHAGLQDLSLSSNGTPLRRFAARLRDAGVNWPKVSLDSLARERFARITRRAALDFAPIKITLLRLPAINGDEVDAMIDSCRAKGFVLLLRLIENMPLGPAARQMDASDLTPLLERLRGDHGLLDQSSPLLLARRATWQPRP